MLLGEHAVLHGRRALVCAINRRITVQLFQCSDPSEAREASRMRGSDRRERQKSVKIFSNLGTYEAPLNDLRDHSDFRFVLDAVQQYPLEQGIELKIESEFSSDIGFGSSAAVTVATHAALMKLESFVGQASLHSESLCHSHAPEYGTRPPGERLCQGKATPEGSGNRVLQEIFDRSLATIHRVQGRGSGADVAASVFGGVVAYRAEPLEVVPLKESFPLTAVYSGSKMKTADVIRLVEERRALNPEYYEKIFDRMDTSVGEVIAGFPMLGPEQSERGRADARQGLQVLAKMLILNQKLMAEMGLCNAALAEIISIFQGLEIPAKISGSGLGDCAIGLGKVPVVGNFPVYSLEVEPSGVRIL